MRRLLSTIGIALGLFTLPAAARADDCADAEDQATMNQCADQDFQAADKALNAAYQQIVARLAGNAEAKKLLVAAQKGWIGFRDAECAFQSSAGADGSVYPMLVADCKTSLTNDRVEQLKTYLDCEEGDMSCPVPPAQ